jgi:toxin ParE1/3/4
MHGAEARIRYRGLLTAALRRIAADPQGLLTVDRSELFIGLRSLHVRHSRTESREALVGNPVHVVFYRVVKPGFIEIVRVLHDRMEPSRHIASKNAEL